MIQQMFAIWSLVPLPFLNPAWTSGSSSFTYCWSLAWRILSITLLACEMSAIVQQFEHSLGFPGGSDSKESAWNAGGLGSVPGVANSLTWLSNFTFTFHFHAFEKEMAIHSNIFAWRIPGMGEPGGLPSLGLHRVRHDWSDLAAAEAAAAAAAACPPHMQAKKCSKFSKPGFNSMWTVNFQMFKLDLEKAEEPEIKLPTSIGS